VLLGQIYTIPDVPLSPDCGHLYFRKQVLHPGSYKVAGLDFQVNCQFGIEVKKNNYGSWEHRSETLAQNAIIFSDKTSHSNPNQGITVTTQGVERKLFNAQAHKLKFPWTLTSGWVLNTPIKIKLGRSAFIWGMQFMPAQLTQNVKFDIKIAYDKPTPASSFVNPTKPEASAWDLTIQPSQLDTAGVFRFMKPDAPTQPMGFVASQIWIEKKSGPNLLNFDFVGTFYNFNTAVDGKHSTGGTDRWNTQEVGIYITKEDGSETTINNNKYNEAGKLCIKHCVPSLKTATKVYAGIKGTTGMEKFKCKCFTGATDKIIGWPGSGFVGRSDPRLSEDCSPLIQLYKDRFNADTGLTNFLAAKTAIQTVTPGAPAPSPSATPNICSNTADVAALYLAHLLDLNVADIVTKYKYDTSKTRVFPVYNSSSGPSHTYLPNSVDLASYPGLDRTFWTVMEQYTGNTEPTIRAGKGRMWCHYAGMGVYEHCLSQNAAMQDCSYSTSNQKIVRCKQIWSYFMEACHRVRSLDPTHNSYRMRSNQPSFWCLSTQPAAQTPPTALYYLYAAWTRSCPEMEDRIYEMADNTLTGTPGWLQLKWAKTGFSKSYRIPGTTYKYKCSTGYYLADKTNPLQELTCEASRRVDFSNVNKCQRELSQDIYLYKYKTFHFQRWSAWSPRTLAPAPAASTTGTGRATTTRQ
jgi:hypothetical protein